MPGRTLSRILESLRGTTETWYHCIMVPSLWYPTAGPDFIIQTLRDVQVMQVHMFLGGHQGLRAAEPEEPQVHHDLAGQGWVLKELKDISHETGISQQVLIAEGAWWRTI